MDYRRITLLCGHSGSGKTNIAVNMALDLASKSDNTVLADLDIVNPYFRSKDSESELAEHNIRLICSDFANTNVDVPALPQQMYAIVDDRSITAVIDVGGDEQGALALGRISDRIREENNYNMFLVVNMYRPLTPDAASVLEIMKEIEQSAHLSFTGLINCSNLGADTDESVVLNSADFAESVSAKTGLKLVATAVDIRLAAKLEGKIASLFPLNLQKRPVDL